MILFCHKRGCKKLDSAAERLEFVSDCDCEHCKSYVSMSKSEAEFCRNYELKLLGLR